MHQSQPLRLYPTGGHFAAKCGGHFKTENGGQLHTKSWGSITHEKRVAIWTEYLMYNHYNNVYAIANQCPYAGGPAVYTARGLLRVVNDSVEYYDDIVCLQAGYYRAMERSNVKDQRIKLLPNPTKGIVDIFAGHTNEMAVMIEIFNGVGEIVYSGLSDMGPHLKTIDVSSFSPGLYSLRVTLEGKFYIEKLVIIK